MKPTNEKKSAKIKLVAKPKTTTEVPAWVKKAEANEAGKAAAVAPDPAHVGEVFHANGKAVTVVVPANEPKDAPAPKTGRKDISRVSRVDSGTPTAKSNPKKNATAPGKLPTKPAKRAKAKDAPAAKPIAPGSVAAIGAAWLAHLKLAGHTPSTIASYENDLQIAVEFFGDKPAADLTTKDTARFDASEAVTKKRNGKGKAMPTVLKTRRALRLALTHAAETGTIKAAPYAAKAS